MEIRLAQFEDDIWHFQIVGQHSSDGTIRIARASMDLGLTTPEEWLAANQTEAQTLVDAGELNEGLSQQWDLADLGTKITNELTWLDITIPAIPTMTAVEVRDVVERLAKENQAMLKAWRRVVNKLA